LKPLKISPSRNELWEPRECWPTRLRSPFFPFSSAALWAARSSSYLG